MLERLASRPALLLALSLLLVACQWLAPPLWVWDRFAYDAMLRLLAPLQPPASPRVVHLDLDTEVSRRWTSDRQVFDALAQALRRLQQQGASLVVLDLLLTGKEPQAFQRLWSGVPRPQAVLLARTLKETYPTVSPHLQGLVELPSDSDGATRSYRLRHRQQNSLALAAYLQVLHGPAPAEATLALPTLRGPTRLHPEAIWVNQQAPWSDTSRRNLRHLSWQDLEGWTTHPPPPHHLEGCVIWVGQVGAGSVDLTRTPLDARFPRVGVHAWAFHDLLQQSWRSPASATTCAVYLLAALWLGGLSRSTLQLLALALTSLALCAFSLWKLHLILPAFSGCFSLLLARSLEQRRATWLGGVRRQRWQQHSDPADPWLQRELGPYLLVERVGRGGFATVYRALLLPALEPSQAVAVKIVHESESHNPDFRRRFLREVRICMQLNHPHLVRLIDSGEQEGALYLVMEFLQGESLRELLESGRRPDQPYRLARQLFEGLSYAHRLHVQHRDLKPENLMLTPRGLKIVDFGLAQDARSSRITKTHELVGTLDYLAPERIQGVVSDPRSDQYSAGVILYEMLTGRTPYQGASSTAEALLWRLTREPAPIAEYRPDLPAAVQALISKMIERDPETRFPTIDEALEALRTLEKSGLIRT